jgi:hypothetical protein
MPVAVYAAGGQGIAVGVLAEDGVDGCGGEDAGEQRAERAACAVDAEGVERVVVAEPWFLTRVTMKEAEDAGDEADQQARHGLDEARGWGDGDQAGDGSGDGSEGGGLAVVDPLGDGPADGCGGGGEVRGDEG